MKNRTILFIAALIFAITPMVAGASVKSQTQGTPTQSGTYCGVTEAQIFEYMMQYGYHVNAIATITGTCDVHVCTLEKREFIVYINPNGIIDGFEEADM